MEFIPVLIFLGAKLSSSVIIAFNLDLSWFAFGIRSRGRHFRRFILPILVAKVEELRTARLSPIVATD
ncbi:MAG TPA: hypothetical protein VGK19_04745 [Capsulimonadaceae bacterium]|jgi:hypothetical protein